MPIYTLDEMSVEEFTEMVTSQQVRPEPLPPHYWDDERWLLAHLAELTEKYPDRWIAVYGRTVVGTGESWTAARQAARQQVGDVGPIVVSLLESKPYVYQNQSARPPAA